MKVILKYLAKKNDSSDDEEEPVDSAKKVDQNDSQVLRPGGISYTSRPIPSKRRLRNVITESPRAIVNSWSENASFEALISEEILRSILMHTNGKLREIQRSFHVAIQKHFF